VTLLSLVAPVLLSAMAFAAPRLLRHIAPQVAVWATTGLVVLSAAATGMWVLVLAGGFSVHASGLGHGTAVGGWLGHHAVVWPVGAAALLLGLYALPASVAVAVAAVRDRARVGPPDGLVISNDDRVVAVAIPGPGAHVIVSTGLLHRLDPSDVDIVIRHERSHLQHRHHRFVLGAELARCVCPWLRPVTAEVRFLVERWADEDTAAASRDRQAVASTIARVALASAVPMTALGFQSAHVSRRVDALLCEAPQPISVGGSIALVSTSAAATGVAGSAMQLHHALSFLR
jgi:hypothetical protein